MKLSTKVVKARWDDDDGVWIITLEDQVSKEQWQDWAHCLVNGAGMYPSLNEPWYNTKIYRYFEQLDMARR